MRAPYVFVSLFAVACGSATPRAPAARAPAAQASAAPAPSATEARACWPTAGSLPPFVAPTGGEAFRSAIVARAPELACCLADDAHAPPVVVTFTPDPDLDRARAELARPAAFDAARAACLDRMLATWIVTPAPRSDVCRRSLNPLGPACTFSTASVTVALPVFRTPSTRGLGGDIGADAL